ncbi:MAG: hypothetical protein WAZ18_02925 [Alphaproteobacteria bacterium]
MKFVLALLLMISGYGMAWAETKAPEHGAAAEGKEVAKGESKVEEAETVRGYSPAELEILQSLEKKKLELDRREQALELREKLVDLMEKRLAERVTEMTTLKEQLETLTKNLSGKEDGELAQLAQMYAAMKPAAAAVVLNRLDNAIVFDVLKRMPVKKSGKIMEAIEPVKARVISEMMAEPVLVVPAKPAATPQP